MVLLGLVAAGVGLAVNKIAERREASSQNNNTSNNPRGLPISPIQEIHYENELVDPGNIRMKQEDDAFKELQHYAEFQRHLSSKVVDELSKEDVFSDDHGLWNGKLPGTEFSRQRQNFSLYLDNSPASQLPYPIIISRERSKDGTQTFVRTYSPSLMQCGIDQQSFLRFMDSFNQSVQYKPQLEVINVAGLAVSGIGLRDTPTLLSIVIPRAICIAKNTTKAQHMNSFLGQANSLLFSPHGLFAMVLSTAKDNPASILPVNAKTSSSATSANVTSLFTQSSLNSRPKSPAVDPDPSTPTKSPSNSRLRRMGEFIAEYGDQRPSFRRTTSAQSSFPSPSFSHLPVNRYHPPNNSNSSQNLLSLISTITSERDHQKSLKTRKRRATKGNPRSLKLQRLFADRKEPETKVEGDEMELKAGELYLVIVNDPSCGKAFEEEDFSFRPYSDGQELRKGKGRQVDTEEAMMDEDDLPPAYSPRVARVKQNQNLYS